MNVQYFGMIAEATGVRIEQLDLKEVQLKKLEEQLIGKYPKLKELNFKFAINQKLETDKNSLVKNTDEIALLPPFAGG